MIYKKGDIPEKKLTCTRDEFISLYYQQNKTLEDIGNIYGVTRERVRQVMDKYNLIRRKTGGQKGNLNKKKIKILEEYFNRIKEGHKENKWLLWKFFLPLKKQCKDCGSTKNLHIHHLKYPATSLEDIQILCCSCHWGKHRKGNGNLQQLKICNEYLSGLSGYQLAQKYNVTPGMIYHILHKWNIETRPRGRLTKNSNKEDLTLDKICI